MLLLPSGLRAELGSLGTSKKGAVMVRTISKDRIYSAESRGAALVEHGGRDPPRVADECGSHEKQVSWHFMLDWAISEEHFDSCG